MTDGTAFIDQQKCVGCGRCIGQCPINAISPNEDNSNEVLGKRMAEYALAVLKDRPAFHINIAIDISPFCDCYSMNDIGIVGDIGMFASMDPVALDRACADAVNALHAQQGSLLAAHSHDHQDHFTALHSHADWKSCLDHCEKIGIGSQQYETVNI